ncbi:carboxylating nicotinate-nucleotide diphosphorylase [Saprospira sp. CCB-QB6]|uniref:carboxylating nicotinate-nucleotide diphosphorylase n=1 Tax=Saprospira sp. CCB-QB6 TaxID=3023936 RepID=UPI00234A1BDC|nr:carboxylating nicotinate-nucleotide diphosphorylase [Saprospira sp. CCB-QB6]WCL82635.1 carboxylating nicotinate-nucleotide diphosphorylase [Saprospira sp. CCB-QB6]
MNFEGIDTAELKDFINRALKEDVGDGDHTSLACIDEEARGTAKLLVKDAGILAGVDLAQAILAEVAPELSIEVYLQDGAKVEVGDIAFELSGPSQSILKVERLILNCMQRMSGIASLTARYVQEVAGLKVQLLDTRKTTPTLRFLEKWAVRIGGGNNYRTGLYDRIMIKDNHIDFCGDVQTAIQQVLFYLVAENKDLAITVEVRDMEELAAVLEMGQVDRIMLDNFSPEEIKLALAKINGEFEVEASGGITLENLRAYAETGVDFISVGALTHSFQSLDLSLKKS